MNRRRRVVNASIIPGLTDDTAELCLSRVPCSCIRTLAQVCRRWRSFVESERFAAVRKSAGVVEDLLCIVMQNVRNGEVYWEVFDSFGNKLGQIPPVPGPVKTCFVLTVLGGRKIVLIGGFTLEGDPMAVYPSSDVYEFDPGVNRWRKLAELNVPRYNFACAEVNGLLYVIPGLSTFSRVYNAEVYNAEVYNPETNKWSFMECPNRPDGLTFAFSFDSKLYVIGNGSRVIDVYDPKTQTWHERNTERSLMACSYTVLRNKVYFLDWPGKNNPYCLEVFDVAENSWSSVFDPAEVPRGMDGISVTLGVWNDKVLLFPGLPGHEILMYDTYKGKGSKWKTCDLIKPFASYIGSVVIRF